MTLDPRINAYRPELAASSLRGKVEAARFADGTLHRIVDPVVPLRGEARPDAALVTEALYGERVTIYDIDDEGWAWGQLARDHYVGFLPANALGRIGHPPTHKVVALRTLGFPAPDIKQPPLLGLPLGAEVNVVRQDAKFATTDAGLYLPASHIAPLAKKSSDFVAVAERFLGTPYLWGGKTALGLDCSGLVQVALTACGISCPRDSDMQEAALGKAVVADLSALRRGDLIFWKGHVAIVRDLDSLLHANAFHMAVEIEPIAEAIARIRGMGSEITGVRRIAPA
jgi:cell wall-associated NlpC family hydrolase